MKNSAYKAEIRAEKQRQRQLKQERQDWADREKARKAKEV